MFKKNVILSAIVILVGLWTFLVQQRTRQEMAVGSNGQYGLPCIYNASTRTLSDGQGTALTCDTTGKIVASPSSTITLQ